MIFWQNRILSNVSATLGKRCTNVVSRWNNRRTAFPACLVKVVANNSVADDLDIDRDEENAVFCGVSVEIYVNTSLQDAYDLMGLANKAMYRMGFTRPEGPIHVEDSAQPEVIRLVARYTRVIGASETIEKFEIE